MAEQSKVCTLFCVVIATRRADSKGEEHSSVGFCTCSAII